MTEPKSYFKSLDAIRLIAATMVVLQHSFGAYIPNISPKGSLIYHLIAICCDGSTGVSLFFVLSGFLITYLLIKESEKVGKINIFYFYTRRILRIWPLYFTVLIFAFLLYPAARGILNVGVEFCSEPWMYFVFLGNFDLIDVFKNCTGNDLLSQNITWSVAIEEQFYIFWPLVFLLAPKKLWIYIMVFLLCCSLVFKIIYIHDIPILYFHTFSVLSELVIGGIAAYFTFYHKGFRRFFQQKVGLQLSLIILLIVLFKLSGNYELLGIYSYGAFKVICSILFAALITIQVLLQDQSKWSLSRLSLFSKWGVYTYGIYMLHPIVLNLVNYFLNWLKLDNTVIWFGVFQFLLCFSGTLLVSFLSYRFFESYFLKLKRKFTLIS